MTSPLTSPVKQVELFLKAYEQHVKTVHLLDPRDPLFDLTFLPLSVQNLICLAPTVTKSLEFYQATPVTLALSTFDVVKSVADYQS
mmetsp:Transcript_28846/g.44321  ORF Transcript_28846/g.44321 Transcript_28846/m.44321 type:complete len:86 (-) Transcript_28846:149-406(-)